MTQDESHLRLLAIFHYVLAGAAAFFSSLFLLHFFGGLAMLAGAFGGGADKNAPPRAMGILFMMLGGGAVFIGWSFATALVVAGRSLSRRKRYTFCLVIACAMCVLCNPLGTILGVFTIVVLMRPSVKEAFAAGA